MRREKFVVVLDIGDSVAKLEIAKLISQYILIAIPSGLLLMNTKSINSSFCPTKKKYPTEQFSQFYGSFVSHFQNVCLNLIRLVVRHIRVHTYIHANANT